MSGVIESAVGTKVVIDKVTIGTTRAPVTAGSVKSKFGFLIKADTGNSGIIYVGGRDVASTKGYPLAAGDSIKVDIEDLINLFILGSANAQILYYIGVA